MSLTEKISSDLREAMKQKEETRIRAIRMLKAELENRRIEKGEDLSEEEIFKAISTLVKKHKESADAYRKGDREELAREEEREEKVLSPYLPKQLSEEELKKIVQEAIAESGASNTKDMGKVMKILMPKISGRAEGGAVSSLVKEALG